MQKYIFVILLLLGSHIGAQSRFKPFKSLDFAQAITSSHFEVYCREGQEEMAARVAKYAEMARGELGYLYDYQPSSKYIIFYTDNAHEVLSSNFWNGTLNTNTVNGYIELQKLDAVVVLPENPANLYATVKHAVSDLLLKEFDYGQELPSIIQNELLTYSVPWFYKGITEFVAKGWTYQDEMFLRSIEAKDFVNLALEGEGKKNSLVRKSIWFFIAHEYGPQKFAELLYISKIAHSSEQAIITVLGIPLNTFTERWREFLVKHIDALKENRIDVEEMPNIQAIPIKKGSKLIDFAYSESAQKIAFYSEKKGKHTFYLYDLETETLLNTNISSGYTNDYTHPFDFHYPIVFSPKGDFVYTTQQINNHTFIIKWDIENQQKEFVPFDSTTQAIHSFSFSTDGKKVALSAIKNGKSDIWIGKSDFSDMKKITDDIFDDISPSWSLDDEILFFSSNRDTNLLKIKNNKWDFFKNDYDIYAYNIKDRSEILERITQTPTENEIQLSVPNSYEIVYLSEKSGMWDLHSHNIFQQKTDYLTALSAGMCTYSAGEQKFAFSTFLQGEQKLFLASFPQKIVNPPSHSAFREEYLTLLSRQKNALFVAKEAQIQANTPDSIPKIPQLKPEKKDSAKAPLRYYIFDDEKTDDHSVSIKKEEKKEKTETITPKSALRYKTEWKDAITEKPQAIHNQWRTEYLLLQMQYNPLPRSGIAFGAGVHDALHHHRFTASVTPYFLMLPFVQFGNADANLRYTYEKNRLDVYGEAGGWRYLYQKESIMRNTLDTALYRFSNVFAKIGAAYPLSAFWKIGGEQSCYFAQKQDLRMIFTSNIKDDKNQFLRTTAYSDFNNLHYREDFPYKGTRFHSEVNRYTALKGSNLSFQNLQFSIQHYQPIWKHIVFASNFKALYSLGGKQQSFYMGGIDNWFLGILRRDRPGSAAYTGKLNTDLTSFAFQEFIMPVRGFWYNARKGSKYMVANFDLRVPFTRMARKVLNDKPLYSYEWVSFFDIGTTWKTGNPFSQKNPTDTQTFLYSPVTVQLQTLKSPFIMGFGTGIKARMLNYTVRGDIAWGIDDNTLQKPILTIGLGRAF